MLYITRFKYLWARLPSSQMLTQGSSLLHLYCASPEMSKPPAQDLCKTFEKNNTVKEMIKDNNIGQYSQEVFRLHPEFLQRFSIRTVPVIIGIHEGCNVGDFTSADDDSSALQLCKNLISSQQHLTHQHSSKEEDALSTQIRIATSGLSKEEAIEYILDLQKRYLQQLEVNEALGRLFFTELLRLYLPRNKENETSVTSDKMNELKRQLKGIDNILSMFKTYNANRIIRHYSLRAFAPESFHEFKDSRGPKMVNSNAASSDEIYRVTKTPIPIYETPLEHDQPIQELKKFCTEHQYTETIRPESLDHYTQARLLKVIIQQDISVNLFFMNRFDASLSIALEAYATLVTLLNEDSIDVEDLEQHGIGKVIDYIFGALSHSHPAVLKARAALETVDGPRLLNPIYKGSRPLGGPVSKRRGFRGKYSWQGPDYRPKKYKPKDPQQYLNEWRYERDHNLPTF